MKAAIRTRYGTPDVVEVVDVERPVPVADQVLVRVHAASVNRADLDGIQPRPAFVRLIVGLRRPRNPRIGIDVAGRVEAVGPRCRRFRPGRQRVRRPLLVRPGCLCGVRVRLGKGVPADPGRDVVRGCRDAPAFGGTRGAGASPPERPDARSGRQDPDRWGVGQRRPIRRSDRQGAWCRSDGRLPDREGRLRAVAGRRPRHRLHEGRLHPRAVSGTTGSSTPTRTIRSSASGARCVRRARTSRWAAPAFRSLRRS